MTRLGDVLADVKPGFATGDDLDDGVFQFRMHNFTRESALDLTKRRRVNATARQLEMQSVAPGDVLFNATNSPELVGKSALIGEIDEPAVFSNHFMRLRTDPTQLDPGYLAHFLRFQFGRGVFRSMAKAWVNQATIGRDRLEGLDIPLPPLPEQRRIAAILDHADVLRTKRRHVLAKLDDLTQSVFHDMFGDPDDASDTISFGQVTALAGGRNLVGDDSAADSDYRVLKISAVTTGQFKPDESKPLPRDYVPPTSHLVRSGDLLMSRANTTELVGAVAYVRSTPPNLALPDKIWRFEWKIDAEPVFWHALLSTPAMRRRVSRLSSGTGGSMKNVSKAKLETMPVPKIDLSRQQAFADRAAQVNQRGTDLNRARLFDDELFASLQSRAFRGELG